MLTMSFSLCSKYESNPNKSQPDAPFLFSANSLESERTVVDRLDLPTSVLDLLDHSLSGRKEAERVSSRTRRTARRIENETSRLT